MKVFLSTTQYLARDRLDIRRGIFAPSEDLERWFAVYRRPFFTPDEAALKRYLAQYTEEMRDSYKAHRADWQLLLSDPEVTLVCDCEDARLCHRTTLGAYILPKLGATFEGERVLRRPEDLTDHECHATGCHAKVPPERLMCWKHWNLVPRDLQREVWLNYRRGQCFDLQVTGEYLQAAQRAVQAVEHAEAQR